MDVAKLNSWFALLMNVAVAIGIIALAVELNQNNELLRSESRQALQSNDQVSLVLAMEHIDLYEKMGKRNRFLRPINIGSVSCSSWICEIENLNTRSS